MRGPRDFAKPDASNWYLVEPGAITRTIKESAAGAHAGDGDLPRPPRRTDRAKNIESRIARIEIIETIPLVREVQTSK